MIPTIEYDGDGNALVDGWSLAPIKLAERDVMRRAGSLVRDSIVRIVEIRHRVLSKKIEKKRDVAAKADIEMRDVDDTRPGPSIQSLIDKGLNARLKKLNLVPAGKKVYFYPSAPTPANEYATAADFVWPEFVQGPSSPQTKDIVSTSAVQQARSQAGYGGQQEGQRYQEGERESSRQGPRSQGQRTRRLDPSTHRPTRLTVDHTVSLWRPSTLPDEILTMSWDSAIHYVHSNVSSSILEASRFRKNVHCSTGVTVPPEIANDLSLGIKYMIYTPPSKTLIKEAWLEFQTRLRWRIFFAFKDGINQPFDPDYAVASESKKRPPTLPYFMELGLVMGRRYVNKITEKIPDEIVSASRKRPFAPNTNKIYQFLLDNNYVITMTDKNLGIAVSERDWLRNNELALLEDKRNYRELSKVEADKIMAIKCLEMEQLADMVEFHLTLSELKLDDYFRSKITEKGAEHIYPQFHGIPKIHKKPTGFRPIVPCHSVVFNPAAKFVSKELKPIVKTAPFVIHGTKDLVIKLSQLRIDPQRRWYFVSGDVVAFYPNIPLKQYSEIVTRMYEEWLFKLPVETASDLEQHRLRLDIFKRAIEIGNTQLITQLGNRYFLQLNGVAMGVSDSPDIASLGGCFFEVRSHIDAHPQVIYYGRYIDDCLALVYANSADEALDLIKNKIAFDGCTIEWAVSESGCQFLDLSLYKESGKLRWRPFVKAGNNRERIPWVSHHPIDVKRGVYVGECSRLAVLCSHKENYLEAIKDLNTLYVMRGYPEEIVMQWCRKNIQERWEKRLASRTPVEHDEEVLVLKTRYDDVWNWFSAAELGKAVTEYWSEWYTRAESGRYFYDHARPFPMDNPEADHGLKTVHPTLHAIVKGRDGEEMFVPDLRKIGLLGSRWIVSRKRNTNLFDLSTQWKKAVFRKLDENVASEGGVDAQSSIVEVSDHLGRARFPVPEHVEEDMEIVLHRRDRSEDREHPEFGRGSKKTN